MQEGNNGAIIIDKPHVTVKSQDPKNPAVFKGTDIPQRDLYLDATSSDKVNKKTKYTFKITNVDFE